MQKKSSLMGALFGIGLLASSFLASAITLDQAIEKVEREQHGKVLGAETVYLGNKKLYRIKVLTQDGQVRVFQIPADDN